MSSTSEKMVQFIISSSSSSLSSSLLRPIKKQKTKNNGYSDTDVYVPTFKSDGYVFMNNLIDKTPVENLYLFDAIHAKDYNSMERQLEYKTTNVNIIERYDLFKLITPLQYAVIKNDLKAVEILLTRNDLLLNLKTPDNPHTALYMNKFAKIGNFICMSSIALSVNRNNPNKKIIALEIEKLLLKGITTIKPLKYEIIRLLFIDHYRNKFTLSSSNDNNNNNSNTNNNNSVGFNVLPMDIIKIIIEYCTIIDVQIAHE